MHCLWFLPAMVLAVLTYRFWRTKLRAEGKSATQFPVPATLPVAQGDLIEVLECLPGNKSVAFCGAFNLSIFLIGTGPYMKDSAPLYVLEGDLDLVEVA
jgi:hypothetical protein